MCFEGWNRQRQISVLSTKKRPKLLARTLLSKRRFSAEKHVRRKVDRFSGSRGRQRVKSLLFSYDVNPKGLDIFLDPLFLESFDHHYGTVALFNLGTGIH